MLNLAVWNVQGLNKRDHQLALKDLISEYRADSESLIISIVYGAFEMIDHRSLWNTLETLAREHSDEPWLTSDHSPLVLHEDRQSQTGGMFRFDNYLTHSPEFIPSLQNIWQNTIVGVPMFAVTRKLKALKPVFREQRRKKGDLTLNVQLAKGFLDEAQQLITLDIGFLRPWARHILSNEEAGHLILAFTPDDVKQAVFDIAEDKAPGPDGYSSGFFKAAWPVVGQEVRKAVLEFFSTGKLLKQVNSTLLALIPKGAFIPGRSIGDNILLAQELLTGYNQDLQFSYHWKCELAKVFQLGFADDLLLFYKADLNSLRILKRGLDRFAEWLGLRLNVQKSHVIISRSAQGWKDQILTIMGFQEGQLPMRYLGLPLLSSRLSISDCQPHLLKIDARINGWEGISLSYAGRIQIIKSVLLAMSIYWASAFILPKAINQIEKRLRTFLWKGTSTSGYAKVARKDVCKPIKEGGQGIKDIGILNRSLIAKKLCDVIRCDRTSIWVEWLKQTRLHNTSIWTINEKGGSWGWRKLLRLRSSILPMTEFLIGEGRSFYLWKDPWHHLGPLIARFPRGPSLLGLDESAKLQVVINEGQWQWPFITDLECMEIIYMLPQIHGGDDRIKWRFSEGRPTT
ncbi:UNVERIFIED_CONTAM: hypothetical protein Sindi_1831400 [Sesamum indicum]